MKITRIETFTVRAGWKSWLLVRLHTDTGLTRLGEGTLNGFNTARGPITADGQSRNSAETEPSRRTAATLPRKCSIAAAPSRTEISVR